MERVAVAGSPGPLAVAKAPERATGDCEQHTQAIGESVDGGCHNRVSMHAAFDCTTMLTMVVVLAVAAVVVGGEEAPEETGEGEEESVTQTHKTHAVRTKHYVCRC